METQNEKSETQTPQKILPQETIQDTTMNNQSINNMKVLSPETGIETMIHTIMSATITSNRVSRSIPFGNKDANMGSMHWFLVGVFL